MICNTVLDSGKESEDIQEEWTPYMAFPNQDSEELFLSSLLNCKFCRRAEDISNTRHRTSWPILKQDKYIENSSSTKTQFTINKTKTENNRHIKKFQSSRTQAVLLWNSIVDNCSVKKRTCWHKSLENKYFLQSIGVDYKPESDKDSLDCNFKCFGCDEKRYQRKLEESEELGVLDELAESQDECSSPCCCPRYYISEHGVVFTSQDEKQIFDEKMTKMDELLKSELKTIREQHDRLQQTHLGEKSEESLINDTNKEHLGINDSTNELDVTSCDLNWVEKIQERQKGSLEEDASSKLIGSTNQLCNTLISTLKEMEAKLMAK